LLLDPQTGELWSKQAKGAAGIEIRFPSSAGLAGYVIRTGQVLNVREDEDLLQVLSSQMAVALENAQLYEGTVTLKNYLVSMGESISSGILTLDQGYHVVRANRAVLTLFERGIADVEHQDIRDLLGPANADIACTVDQVYATHREVVMADLDSRTERGCTSRRHSSPRRHRGRHHALSTVSACKS